MPQLNPYAPTSFTFAAPGASNLFTFDALSRNHEWEPGRGKGNGVGVNARL